MYIRLFEFIFVSWNRWGRVGEVGMNNGLEFFSSAEAAIKSFEKKFKDKTKNDWKSRENFVPHAGKYTLIEMDAGGDDDDTNAATSSTIVLINFDIFLFLRLFFEFFFSQI